MTETKETAEKTLRGAAPRKPLSLKRTVDAGHVKQSFSHGRSKSVVVEKKKKRTISGPGGETDEGAAQDAEANRLLAEVMQRSGGLSTDELDARRRALEVERDRTEAEEIERARLEALRPQPDPETRAEETPAPVAGAAEEQGAAAEQVAPPTQREPQPTEAKTRAPDKGKAQRRRSAWSRRLPSAAAVRSKSSPRRRRTHAPRRKAPRPPAAPSSPAKTAGSAPSSPSTTLSTRRSASARSPRCAAAASARSCAWPGVAQPRDKVMREVIIPEVITIQELANRMTERAVDVIKLLMGQGAMHKINDVIDADTAELIVREFGHTPKRVSEADVEEGFIGADRRRARTCSRARPSSPSWATSTTARRRCSTPSATPTSWPAKPAASPSTSAPTRCDAAAARRSRSSTRRATRRSPPCAQRGANVTDIVVLVVAADDGVMPQTVEAINHAKAAGVPIIVAINKIDKPDADPNRVRTDLLQHEIVVESMSGETLEVEVSALKRTGLDKLLEAIQLQAELLDLQGQPESLRRRRRHRGQARARPRPGRHRAGPARHAASVGDIVVAGAAWGRVRALIDDRGEPVTQAGPSVPVEILGFDSAPEAGDQFAVVENEGRAREITDYRVRKRRQTLGSAGTARTLEQMMQQLKEAGRKEFPLVDQGRRAGLGRGHRRRAAQARHRRGRGAHRAFGRRRHHRIRRRAGQGVAAVVVGFNVRANAQAKLRWPSRPASRSATTRSSTTWSTT